MSKCTLNETQIESETFSSQLTNKIISCMYKIIGTHNIVSQMKLI